MSFGFTFNFIYVCQDVCHGAGDRCEVRGQLLLPSCGSGGSNSVGQV